MVRYLITVKIGVETAVEGFFKTIVYNIRDTVTGKTYGGGFTGSEDMAKDFFELLESNPEYKISYE